MTTASLRPAAVAGQFYPGSAAALSAELDRLLAEAEAPAAPPPKILVVPHAGYRYSGAIAASAYARLAGARGRVRRVVLLGPCHRVAVQGVAIPSVAAFQTPLGEVRLDRAGLDALREQPGVVLSDAAHAQEHALEVQLPFLQRLLGGDFELLPLAVGQVAAVTVAALLERLWGGDETLIVISTDLSHYLPYAAACAVDRATIAQVLAGDPELDHEQACGATPLAAALLVARRHDLKPRLLDLRNSGDTAGDRARVVGYAALSFAPADGLEAQLLDLARQSIAGELGLDGPTPRADHPALQQPAAVFVSLHLDGRLRGCIGQLQPEGPLGEAVRRMARKAAFEDPRFPPLSVQEWRPGLEIEVSRLSPPEPLPAASEAQACAALKPQRDGVILQWRGQRATFLPQVWQQLAEPRDFLAALKRKAGLAEDFWAEDLRLQRYRVEACQGPACEESP